MPSAKGTIRLFQIFGITVFLHWSWFIVAIYEIDRPAQYSSVMWSVLEYLALFGIVLLHEFGHALACRSVGGTADQIVLWPLGGVAYVNPPARPGATLWSIAAGPLVNVALIPVLGGLAIVGSLSRGSAPASDFNLLLRELNIINLVLFFFNVLPIYPLDGGKILRSVLWFFLGRARSLMATVVVGFIGVAGLGFLAIQLQSAWLAVLVVFAAMQCISGYKQAKTLSRLEALPRRTEFACPSCKANPPMGPFWLCNLCGRPFDSFDSHATCPVCSKHFSATMCLDCRTQHPFEAWSNLAAAPTK
jgi:Zn-dependent protease